MSCSGRDASHLSNATPRAVQHSSSSLSSVHRISSSSANPNESKSIESPVASKSGLISPTISVRVRRLSHVYLPQRSRQMSCTMNGRSLAANMIWAVWSARMNGETTTSSGLTPCSSTPVRASRHCEMPAAVRWASMYRHDPAVLWVTGSSFPAAAFTALCTPSACRTKWITLVRRAKKREKPCSGMCANASSPSKPGRAGSGVGAS
mmetsp:Transcript_15816/g.40885  ORF Transcript_15816/g.40885 Transcript_15816/m.40885 type:complete len:207 (-) Transcript_15816:182-802(-)